MSIRQNTFLLAITVTLGGCALTDVTSVPFDVASTVADSATSSSSSSGGDESADRASLRTHYVATQIDSIREDAARGHGEALEVLALLLNENDVSAFGLWTRANYAELFTDLEQPTELLARIDTLRP